MIKERIKRVKQNPNGIGHVYQSQVSNDHLDEFPIKQYSKLKYQRARDNAMQRRKGLIEVKGKRREAPLAVGEMGKWICAQVAKVKACP